MKKHYIFLIILSTLSFLVGCSPKEIPRPAPKASFVWSSVGEGTIQFTDQSTEADSYEWNFGDSSSINTEKNPKHTFKSNTKHIISLTVANSTASDKATQEIEVQTIKPTANFAWTNLNGQVTFTNTSSNANSYTWDFGNGKNSLEPNPVHRYLKSGTYTVKLTAKGKAGEVSKMYDVLIPVIQYTMADVVDDQSLLNFLPGVWGIYVNGEGNRFDNYTYRFSRNSNTLNYQNYYHPYIYIMSDFQTIKIDYKYSITDKIIYVDDLTGKQIKHARIQIVSEDEMKVFRIIETNTSYSEGLPNTFTRTSDIEKSIDAVVKSQSLLSVLKGVWDQGAYSIYKDVFFDFSAGKNFYNYNSTFQESKSIQKKEFKIDANNIMRYRNWNSSIDPSWKKYKVEVVSNTILKLYPIDENGNVSKIADYTLTKRS